MVEAAHVALPIVRQRQLLSISRSSCYHADAGESEASLAVMRVIDEQFLQMPWYGSRQMARHLRRLGHEVGRKRVRRLMRKMGLEAVCQRPKTTVANPEHKAWPYLLRNKVIDQPNQIWCTDISVPQQAA